jgi:anti-anti-sigma factor
MNVQRQNGTLTVDELTEMSAANARALREEVRAAVSPDLKHVDIDLSQVSVLDGYGIGAIASLYAVINGQRNNGEVPVVRLLHPQPPVRQLLELTRMNDIFEIVPKEGESLQDRTPAPKSVLSSTPP